VWPTPKASTAKLEITGLYRNNSNLPVSGATVSVCGPVPSGGWPGDPSCLNAPPVAMGTTDARGDTTIEVPLTPSFDLNKGGWVGFLRFDAPGYPPNFNYSGYPASEATYVAGPPFGRAQPMDPDPSPPGTGTVWVIPGDCLFSPAGGVKVTDENGNEAFSPGGSPEGGTGGVGSPTPGIGVYYSFPAGPHTFTAKPIGLGSASSTVKAYVEDGGVTWVILNPTP
jgi:hypothetical protein